MQVCLSILINLSILLHPSFSMYNTVSRSCTAQPSLCAVRHERRLNPPSRDFRTVTKRDTYTHKSRTKIKSHKNKHKQTNQTAAREPPFPLFHQLQTLDTPEQKKLTLSAGRSFCLNYTLRQLKAFLLAEAQTQKQSTADTMSRSKDKRYVTEILGVTL